jgi:hypothetical protein
LLTCLPPQWDLIAGLSVGAMVVPQGMSYAVIAGLPFVYGLYGAAQARLGPPDCVHAGVSAFLRRRR